MNSIETFESHLPEKLNHFLLNLETRPASTLTFIAKPDRYLNPTRVKLLLALTDQELKTQSKKNFLNCVSLKFYLDKVIVCKFFKNGTLQITGCKSKHHPILICQKVQAILRCEYTISLVMENVYSELFLPVDKLKLYSAWRKAGNQASPPIGSYTAVRLRVPLENIVQTKYFIWKGKTFAVSSLENRASTVNIAIFNNGKILFSGINRNAILTAANRLVQFTLLNKNIFVQYVNKFC